MSDDRRSDETDFQRRGLLQGAGLAVMSGMLAPTLAMASTAPRNNMPLGARLQGVVHTTIVAGAVVHSAA